MPELPDLVYIEKRLTPLLPGRKILALEIFEPVVIRNLLGEDLRFLLPGKAIEGLHRHGHFLKFDLEGGWFMVVHFMLAGRFALQDRRSEKHPAEKETDELSDRPAKQVRKRNHVLCFSLQLDGITLDYLDDKKMGKVYFCKEEDLANVPGYAKIGPDLLGPGFTPGYFLSAMGKSRRQVRVFLKDHALVNSVGNAYADEILFEAKIHPMRTSTR